MKVLEKYRVEPKKRRVTFELSQNDDPEAFDYVLIATPRAEVERQEAFNLPNINQRGELICFYVSPPCHSDLIDAGIVGWNAWSQTNLDNLAKIEGKSTKEIEKDLLTQFRQLRRDAAKQLSAKIEEILIAQSNEAQIPIIKRLTGWDTYRQDYVTALESKKPLMVRAKKGKVTVKPIYMPSGKKAKYDLSRLSSNYRDLLVKWKEAAITAKQSDLATLLKKPNNLPEDLVQRLWPLSKEERSKLESKGHSFNRKGNSRLSEIALEHAARQCDVPPYELTVSRLRAVERELRNKEASK